MASPVIAGQATSSTNTAGTNHVLVWTGLGTVAAGDLLIIILDKGSTSATVNAHADYTELLDEASANGLYIAYRWATGGETAPTLVTSASTRSAEVTYRITGAINPATQAPEINATTSSGTSTLPAPPAAVMTGGSKDYLVIAFFGMAGEQADDATLVTTFPTSYSVGQAEKTCGVAGVNLGGMIGAAGRQLTASAENPGTFTAIDNAAWRSQTITVHPSASVTTDKTITALGRISVLTDKTITSLARITSITNKTITSLARVTAITDKTITALSRITDTVDQPITSLARITDTVDQAITSLGRITDTVDQTITSKANISTGTTVDKTITALGRISVLTDKTITSLARITDVVDKDITSLARITDTADKDITSLGRITDTVDQTITSLARVSVITDKTITALARVTDTVDRTITSVASISGPANRTITSLARIQKTIDKTITAIASIVVISKIKTLTSSIIRNINGISFIRQTTELTSQITQQVSFNSVAVT